MNDALPDLSIWADAAMAARLFALDPVGTGGVALRAQAGPVRARWLSLLRETWPQGEPMRHLPLHTADSRLLGGLDLAATLRAGRPVAERGLLAEADGGIVTLAMAERLSASTVAHVTAALDAQETAVERDGLSLRMPARIGVVALDEGGDDEQMSPSLLDRVAFHVDLHALSVNATEEIGESEYDIAAARARLLAVTVEPGMVEAICAAAAALGIASLRAPLLALRVARAHAALEKRTQVTQDDLAVAARLVLAPRALVVPQGSEAPADGEANEERPDQDTSSSGADDTEKQEQSERDPTLDEIVLAAAQAAIPPGLLAALRVAAQGRSRARSAGRAGALQKSVRRGRPAGVQRGELRSGARLNVIETLRAAAPWQALRRREDQNVAGDPNKRPRVLIRKDDFRVTRFKQRTESIAIFVVDASGSAALHRLAEAKGAVELLLADCYVRRDQVALIAFRGTQAELLLPPTRSLARAKRSLAGLPGGGGTPLAAGLDAAFLLADTVRRKGQTPNIILLTDGRANIARDGTAGRPRAEEDARHSARQVRAAGVRSLLVDMSPRPQPLAEALAREMDALYLALPHAGASELSQAVRAATPSR